MIRRSMMPMLGQAQTPEQEAQQMNILRLMQSATNQQARSQGAFDMMRRGNNGAGGYLGALAMGIGGYLNRKKQEKAEAQQLEALREIGLLKQSQGEWAREQAARQAAAEQAKYERDKADEAEKYAREQAGRMELAQMKAGNKEPRQMSVAEQQWSMLTPEQQQQAAMVSAGLAKKPETSGVFSTQEQALIKSGKVSADQLMQAKADKALGVSKESATERQAKKGAADLVTSLNKLDGMLSEHGTEYFGGDAKLMKTVHTDALLALKEAAKLGALTGPDMELVDGLLNDPTTLGAQMNPMAAGNIRKQIKYLTDKYGAQTGNSQGAGMQSEKQENTLLKYTR